MGTSSVYLEIHGSRKSHLKNSNLLEYHSSIMWVAVYVMSCIKRCWNAGKISRLKEVPSADVRINANWCLLGGSLFLPKVKVGLFMKLEYTCRSNPDTACPGMMSREQISAVLVCGWLEPLEVTSVNNCVTGWGTVPCGIKNPLGLVEQAEISRDPGVWRCSLLGEEGCLCSPWVMCSHARLPYVLQATSQSSCQPGGSAKMPLKELSRGEHLFCSLCWQIWVTAVKLQLL